mgnify:CR=1 FL=1|tara:strand:- start:309 stop:596 length:288 start_codon:yes stop_codon:yes gene_type:complete
MYDFIQVIHKDTKQTKIVEELSDEVFDNGYRFVQYVSNSQIDYPELYASQQEDTLQRMQGSASDPCYWNKESIENGKYDNDMESDPIYRPALEIY